MAYKVKILADSINPCGNRLTTFELTYPRFVHSEFMTHRVFSRNSASSRAIPIQRMIHNVITDPVVPVWFGKNQKGVQAKQELTGWRYWLARQVWLKFRYVAIIIAWLLWKIGLHKQIANRLLEPWMWITVICSATEYNNFFNLRCHPDAQPEIKKLADWMMVEYLSHQPLPLKAGQWHLPLLFDGEIVDHESFDATALRKEIATGRVARVSYLTHNGKRDIAEDIRLHNDLLVKRHMSPFEHIAQALGYPGKSGNFVGWKQYRKDILNENQLVFDPGPNQEIVWEKV